MRLVVLGDLHYAHYTNPAHAAARDRFFSAFFRQVADLQADFVFAIGDTTQKGLLSELAGEEQIATELGLKLIRTTGNHDTDTLDKSEIAPYFLGGRPSASPTELYTSFEAGPARFILLDTARSKVSSIDWSGFVSEEQLSWLAHQIEEFNATPALRHLFIFGHHPFYATTKASTREMLYIANGEAVRPVFATLERKPGFYICGHNHVNSLFGPDEFGWYHVQAGAPLDCESFRLITLTDEQLEIETIDIDFSNPAVREDFETTRHSIEEDFTVHPLEWMYGKPTDRQLKLDLQPQ